MASGCHTERLSSRASHHYLRPYGSGTPSIQHLAGLFLYRDHFLFINSLCKTFSWILFLVSIDSLEPDTSHLPLLLDVLPIKEISSNLPCDHGLLIPNRAQNVPATTVCSLPPELRMARQSFMKSVMKDSEFESPSLNPASMACPGRVSAPIPSRNMCFKALMWNFPSTRGS